jgi:hypothetical protein
MERDGRTGLLVPERAARRGRGRDAVRDLVARAGGSPEAVGRAREDDALAPLAHLAAEAKPARAKRKRAKKAKAPAWPVHRCHAMGCTHTDAEDEQPMKRAAFTETRPSGARRNLREWYICDEHLPTWRPPANIAMIRRPADGGVVSADWRAEVELDAQERRRRAPADMVNAGTHPAPDLRRLRAAQHAAAAGSPARRPAKAGRKKGRR